MTWQNGKDSNLARLLLAVARLSTASARLQLQEHIIRGLQQAHGLTKAYGLKKNTK